MFYWVSSLHLCHLCHLWESFFSKRFCVFRAFSGNICPPTDFTDLHRCEGAFKGVHLSPLGFAACQSKKCTNRAKSIFSHRFHSKFAEECDAVA